MSTPPTTRLHGVMASQAPVAVLVRHGGTRRAQIIKWNTDTDTFERGQWLKGRIAVRTVALSPNGSLMVYSASDYGRSKRRTPEQDWPEWTALSKPPYLTALRLWFIKGEYGIFEDSGGFFETDDLLKLDYVRGGPDRSVPIPNRFQIVGTNGKSAVAEILDRAGWRPCETPEQGKWRFGKPNLWRVWEKELDGLRLVRREYWGARRHDLRHAFEPDAGLDLDGADWADFDQRGRFVFARLGKVFAAYRSGSDWDVRELADFSGDRFEPVEAPDWAKVW